MTQVLLEENPGGQATARPRLGFLGVGWIGRHRMEAIVNTGAAAVAAIADPSPEMAAEAGKLAPGAEVALARDRLRPEKTVAAAWTHLDAVIRRGLGEAGLWVDNGGMTADETVAHILAAQAHALVE